MNTCTVIAITCTVPRIITLQSSATRSSATQGSVATRHHPPNNLAETEPVNPVAVVSRWAKMSVDAIDTSRNRSTSNFRIQRRPTPCNCVATIRIPPAEVYCAWDVAAREPHGRIAASRYTDLVRKVAKKVKSPVGPNSFVAEWKETGWAVVPVVNDQSVVVIRSAVDSESPYSPRSYPEHPMPTAPTRPPPINIQVSSPCVRACIVNAVSGGERVVRSNENGSAAVIKPAHGAVRVAEGVGHGQTLVSTKYRSALSIRVITL